MRKFPESRNAKDPKSQNVDIHLGRSIQRGMWHLIREIDISRLGVFSMEHSVDSWNMKSQNVKSRSTLDLDPWSQPTVIWKAGL